MSVTSEVDAVDAGVAGTSFMSSSESESSYPRSRPFEPDAGVKMTDAGGLLVARAGLMRCRLRTGGPVSCVLLDVDAEDSSSDPPK